MKSLIIPFLLISLLFSSCGTVYYPQTVNVPMLKEKGQTVVDASANTASVTLSGARAISDKFAIAAALNAWRYDVVFINSRFRANGFQLNVMPGVYKTFGKTGIAEFYGGYGLANINWKSVKGLTHQLILQPSFGWANEYAQISFSARTTFMTSGLYYPQAQEGLEADRVAGIFVDPAITLKLGGPKLWIFGQSGFTYEFTERSPNPGFAMLTVGFKFSPFGN